MKIKNESVGDYSSQDEDVSDFSKFGVSKLGVGKNLLINGFTQTFGDSITDQNVQQQTKQADSDIQISQKLVLDNTPIISFDSCVDKLDKEMAQPRYEVIKIKSHLGKII